ncbi:MAG TPA: methionyl-tRNA formyltransferase [Vicinamibacterales bacterium]|jgi:methionyl-tRNA formyltransferase
MVSLRIVFLGTPAFAVPSLEVLLGSRHQVVAVVSQPDRPRGRGQHVQATPTKQIASAHGVPVLQPAKIKDESFQQTLRELQPDLGVVVAFGRILPDSLLAIPRLGMINVHASLLPRYRGAAPIQRAVLSGDAETGVTIMRVASELDAGPTFSMAAAPIPPDATSGDMETVLARLGAEQLLPIVDALADARATETPQDHAAATHAAKITKGEGAVDWGAAAPSIHDLARGLQPWPLASTTLDGARVVLRRTAAVGLDTHDALPGTIVRAHGDELTVACGGGTALQILEIQPEGRRTQTAREFLAGRHSLEGARLGT